jgi:hypothetical protein
MLLACSSHNHSVRRRAAGPYRAAQHELLAESHILPHKRGHRLGCRRRGVAGERTVADVSCAAAAAVSISIRAPRSPLGELERTQRLGHVAPGTRHAHHLQCRAPHGGSVTSGSWSPPVAAHQRNERLASQVVFEQKRQPRVAEGDVPRLPRERARGAWVARAMSAQLRRAGAPCRGYCPQRPE